MTEIILGSAADIPAIMPVMASAFNPAFGEAWSAEQIRGALSIPGCSLLLVRRRDAIIGFALVRVVLDEAELLLIAIDKGDQQQGQGRTLYTELVAVIQNQGAKKLHVEVRSDNPAMTFYNSLGFDKVGERLNYYRRKDGGSTTGITLSRQLS